MKASQYTKQAVQIMKGVKSKGQMDAIIRQEFRVQFQQVIAQRIVIDKGKQAGLRGTWEFIRNTRRYANSARELKTWAEILSTEVEVIGLSSDVGENDDAENAAPASPIISMTPLPPSNRPFSPPAPTARDAAPTSYHLPPDTPGVEHTHEIIMLKPDGSIIRTQDITRIMKSISDPVQAAAVADLISQRLNGTTQIPSHPASSVRSTRVTQSDVRKSLFEEQIGGDSEMVVSIVSGDDIDHRGGNSFFDEQVAGDVEAASIVSGDDIEDHDIAVVIYHESI